MSIVIFGDIFTFPEGDAATNRVYTYAKGFIENGVKVHVISFENLYNSAGNGQINEIAFYHPFGQIDRNKYIVVRQYQKLLKHLNTIRLFSHINKEEKIIAINICTNLLLTHLFSWFLAKIYNSKLIIEANEHPLRHFQKSALDKKLGAIKFHIETYFCDGLFCISHFLMNFYKSKGVNDQKLFLVPSTVDPERFSIISKNPNGKRYIGYFGSLTFRRDSVDTLINAFAHISNNNPDIELVLGGFCSDAERNQIVDLIEKLNIQTHVKLLGYLKREEIIAYVSNADILVMVRSNNQESRASYPSKLSEFLASSKPVITVNVGEIPLYISDGVNAFMVEPESATALAEKLEYVLSNYELAIQVGQKGKELTDTVFNYNFQAKRMFEFISSLK